MPQPVIDLDVIDIRYDDKPCLCGSEELSGRVYDAQGIYCTRVCEACAQERLQQFRPEILDDYDQDDVDEPIEPEE